jgi:CubicO group peptidase (beta-lactamase class C family)
MGRASTPDGPGDRAIGPGAKIGVVRRLAALAVGLALLAACSDDADTASTTSTTTTVVPTSTTSAAVPFPRQPDGVPWPTDEWARGELPAGVDRAAIDAATDTAFADGADDRVRATVIVHGGAIVYERYSPNPDDGPDVVMPSYSIAKSVTADALGILARDDRLSADDPAPVPEWHEDPDDPRGDATVRDMLAMQTGVPWEDGYPDPGTNMTTMVQRDDMAAYAASLEATAPPGTRFDYNTGTTILLDRALGEEVGDVEAFLRRELFDPLGIGEVELFLDDAGTWGGGFSADMTAEDFARLGLLHLRAGEWDGEEVLPVGWIELERTPSDRASTYAHHWWFDPLRPGVSYAIGSRGQVITVDPAHDLVVVQLSTVGGDLPLAQTEAILDAFASGE